MAAPSRRMVCRERILAGETGTERVDEAFKDGLKRKK